MTAHQQVDVRKTTYLKNVWDAEGINADGHAAAMRYVSKSPMTVRLGIYIFAANGLKTCESLGRTCARGKTICRTKKGSAAIHG